MLKITGVFTRREKSIIDPAIRISGEYQAENEKPVGAAITDVRRSSCGLNRLIRLSVELTRRNINDHTTRMRQSSIRSDMSLG